MDRIKTDQDKAAETIAISTAYVLVIGIFFAPYLPQLSKSILSYFGLTSESELDKKVYQGDLNAMKDFFKTDFKLHVDPKGLVPKIDPKVIEELDLQLKEKAGTYIICVPALDKKNALDFTRAFLSL